MGGNTQGSKDPNAFSSISGKSNQKMQGQIISEKNGS